MATKDDLQQCTYKLKINTNLDDLFNIILITIEELKKYFENSNENNIEMIFIPLWKVGRKLPLLIFGVKCFGLLVVVLILSI